MAPGDYGMRKYGSVVPWTSHVSLGFEIVKREGVQCGVGKGGNKRTFDHSRLPQGLHSKVSILYKATYWQSSHLYRRLSLARTKITAISKPTHPTVWTRDWQRARGALGGKRGEVGARKVASMVRISMDGVDWCETGKWDMLIRGRRRDPNP